MEIHVTEFVFNDDIGLIQEAYNRFRYLLFFLSTWVHVCNTEQYCIEIQVNHG